MTNPTRLKEWQQLAIHRDALANQHMRDWFVADPERFARFSLASDAIFLDYSRNRITPQTVSLLTNLAKAVGLRDQMNAIFSGALVNNTEKRPALHSSLRNHDATILVANKNIQTDIIKTEQRIWNFVNKIHSHTWRGMTGKPMKYVVNIGIGGSHTGPMMCTHALKDYAIAPLQFYFMASVDQAHIQEILGQINPEETLFIISSKSFSTIETLTNVRTVMAWIENKLGPDAIKQHFVAVTAVTEKAKDFGIPEEQIFPLWEWIGGRYSIWSAIGLPLMLMIGAKNFTDFLAGGHAMDKHFQNTAFEQNIPVMLALLGIWYTNFFGSSAHAIIPYAHRLRYLIPYLQQADMESNGKSVGVDGSELNYATGPVIFGEEGLIGQHAYHQLLHQGQPLIPADFIVVGQSTNENDTHQNVLLASALSQAQALMRGKTQAEAKEELLARNVSEVEAAELAKHQAIPGNKPCNLIFMTELSPHSLGALIAMYEHKIFVQGIIWGINSFDQWGVELGKQLLPAILHRLQGTQPGNTYADSATTGLIELFFQNRDA